MPPTCLDPLWLLESLSREREIKAAYPEIDKLRSVELLRFMKTLLRAPRAVTLHLKNDPAGRRGFVLLPRWTKSALGYVVSRAVRGSS